MKALVLVIGLVAGCANHPVAPASRPGYELRKEQAEIDQEAREQQQLQIRQQQQQEEQQQLQPRATPTPTPTFSQ